MSFSSSSSSSSSSLSPSTTATTKTQSTTKEGPPPCQQFACAIQDCLQRNNYQEAKCQKPMEALKDCCNELLAKGGASACCPRKKQA